MKLAKTIYCEKCSKEIEKKSDLITATLSFDVVAYHDKCFATDLKGKKTLLLSNEPINSFASNLTTIISVLFGVGLLYFVEGPSKWISLLAFIPLMYRIYSYFTFERYLK